ncbi:hypothetical protein BU17DRAFT_43779 [Hysterangium stoloniferum]|nr:hypothetical protein BU17DRAFT_43779 [Hysterangium stoloniferum]
MTPHRLHNIPYVTSIIFNSADIKTCYACALVCKAWLEPALDELWRVIEQPVALFRLLGPMHLTRWMAFHIWVYSALVLPSAWTRFQYYARRIRRFIYIEDGTAASRAIFDISVFAEIARTRRHLVVLPYLQHLQWQSVHLGYATLFMHAELSQLTVSLDRFPMDAHGFEAAATFLCECASRLPDLSELDLRASFSVSEVEAQLLGMLRCFRRLKKLSLPRFWITTSVLAVVADLPYLERIGWEPFAIWTEHANDVDIINFAEPDRSFPELDHISLETSFTCVTRLLEDGTLPTRLTSIMISTIDVVMPRTLQHFFQLCAACYPALTDLVLHLFPVGKDPLIFYYDIISFETLQPILAIPTIRSFALWCPEQLPFTDANLEEIAQRWPDLTHLSLTSDPYIESHPRLTLSALVSLATHCPRLRHVTLYLDLTAPFPSSPTSCLSNIQLIDVGTSPISREVAKPTALFISLLCSTSSLVVGPSKQLRLQVNVESGPSWDPVLYDDIPRERKNAIWKNCEIWEMVDEDLPYLVAAREAGSERLRVLE